MKIGSAAIVISALLALWPKVSTRCQPAGSVVWSLFVDGRYGEAADLLLRMKDRGTSSGIGPRVRSLIVRSAWWTRGIRRLESDDGTIEVLYRPDPDSGVAILVLDTVQRQLHALLRYFPETAPGPLRVEVLPGPKALAEMAWVPESLVSVNGIAGFTRFGKMMVLSPAAFDGGYPFLDTVAHEVVHLLLNRVCGDAVPVWVHEMIARTLQDAWRSAEEADTFTASVEWARLRAGAMKGALLPLPPRVRSLPEFMSGRDVAMAFAELHALGIYLRERYGSLVFARLCSAWRQSGRTRVFEKVTGRRLEDLITGFKIWLSGRIREGPRPGRLVLCLLYAQTGWRPSGALWSRVRLGRLYRRAGRAAEAAEEFEVVVRTGMAAMGLYTDELVGAVRESRGAKEALDLVKDFRGLWDDFPGLAREAGLALCAVGRYRECASALWAYVRHQPYDREVHAALREALERIGARGEATLEQRVYRALGGVE